jgi:excisionase family DNA binding protein
MQTVFSQELVMTATTPTPRENLVRNGFAEIAEAQAYLKLSRGTIYNLMDSGQLSYARFGRRRRIPWKALRDYAERNLVTR